MNKHINRKILHSILKKIKTGFLEINYIDSGEKISFGIPGSKPHGIMNIMDSSLISEIITQGEFGIGMGYVKGKWDSPSVYHVMLVFMLNEHYFRKKIQLFSKINFRSLLLQKQLEKRRQNSIENCRKEIGITYDIGNDFYKHMLGPSMCYTCAIWPHPEATLEEAQENKMKLITQKARIDKSHSVLDIGCGWGSLCSYIHDNTGAKVKGIALSHEQINYCKETYPHLDFEYCDYREFTGEYDRIVSAGMAEHVGTEYFGAFMKKVNAHLKPGGRFVLHTMIYHGNDVFMDGEKPLNFSSVLMPNADSPTPALIVKHALRTGELRLLHYETFGIHYARTAHEWLANLQKNRDKILQRYSEKLYKSHEYSWHMGSAAMETGISLLQIVFEKNNYGSGFKEAIL